ncbi:MAG TPA: DUF167 family protein [Candidatus Nanoarchaeia archaeon]|nr:DUF167 family protein [Candidatus Nanoarchaeia archaeon]
MTRWSVVVKPNSKDSSLSFDKDLHAYICRVKSKPENNKANLELVKLFYKKEKRRIKIVSGLTSKKKMIEVLE